MAGASKMKKPAAQDKALPEQGSEGNGGLPAEGKVKPEPKSPAKPQPVKLEVVSPKRASPKRLPKLPPASARKSGSPKPRP